MTWLGAGLGVEQAEGKVIVAIWMVDAEFGTVGTVRLAGLNEAQLRGFSVLNTFGNTLELRVSSGGVDFSMGRDACYLVFSAGAVTAQQAQGAVLGMLEAAVPAVGGSVGWPTPFW